VGSGDIGFLTIRRETVLETSVLYKHLTRLIAPENCVEFCSRESFRSHIKWLDVSFDYKGERNRYMNNQGNFCDGTRRNSIPLVISQKDASRNGVPETFFLASMY
jgi:hypothetical protein